MENQVEIKLQETLTGDKAETLSGEILGARGSALNIDASEVARIDTTCIEILIAARKLWADEDCPLTYSNISEKFETALASIGLEKTNMETGAA